MMETSSTAAKGLLADHREEFSNQEYVSNACRCKEEKTLTFSGGLWVSDEGSKIQIFTESNCPAVF